MVKLEEVEDEAFLNDQPGPEDEGEWDTDDGAHLCLGLLQRLLTWTRVDSDTSSIASSVPDDETLMDRVSALKDVIPPAQRRALSSTASAASEWGRWGFNLTMKGVWVLSASLLLLGVPFALASTEDQQIAMEEKQMNMQASANEVSVFISAHGHQSNAISTDDGTWCDQLWPGSTVTVNGGDIGVAVG